LEAAVKSANAVEEVAAGAPKIGVEVFADLTVVAALLDRAFFFFIIIYIALSNTSINTMMLMQPLRLWSAAHALLIPLS
jgi:hypothetical protein